MTVCHMTCCSSFEYTVKHAFDSPFAVQQCQEPLAYILPPLALTQAKKRKKSREKTKQNKNKVFAPSTSKPVC